MTKLNDATIKLDFKVGDTIWIFKSHYSQIFAKKK